MNSKQAGYSYKNYLIESAMKLSIRAAFIAGLMSSGVQLIAWANLIELFGQALVGYAALLIPASTVLWLATWAFLFDRIITYSHWMAWFPEWQSVRFEELTEKNPPTLPETKVIRVYKPHKNGYSQDKDASGEVG